MKIRRGDILYVDLGVLYQGSIQGSMFECNKAMKPALQRLKICNKYPIIFTAALKRIYFSRQKKYNE